MDLHHNEYPCQWTRDAKFVYQRLLDFAPLNDVLDNAMLEDHMEADLADWEVTMAITAVVESDRFSSARCTRGSTSKQRGDAFCWWLYARFTSRIATSIA
jgi:hypothetical protein